MEENTARIGAALGLGLPVTPCHLPALPVLHVFKAAYGLAAVTSLPEGAHSFLNMGWYLDLLMLHVPEATLLLPAIPSLPVSANCFIGNSWYLVLLLR